MNAKLRVRIPFGALAAPLIFIYTYTADFWSKLAPIESWVFMLALIILFFQKVDFSYDAGSYQEV